MKKLQKIKLDELAGIDLNERGLCRIFGRRNARKLPMWMLVCWCWWRVGNRG